MALLGPPWSKTRGGESVFFRGSSSGASVWRKEAARVIRERAAVSRHGARVVVRATGVSPHGSAGGGVLWAASPSTRGVGAVRSARLVAARRACARVSRQATRAQGRPCRQTRGQPASSHGISGARARTPAATAL